MEHPAKDAFVLPLPGNLSFSGQTSILDRQQLCAEERVERSLCNIFKNLLSRTFLADVAQLPVFPQLELTHRLKRNAARQNVGTSLLGHGVNGR